MPKNSNALETLKKARFFVDQAELTGIADREAFLTYLEAAIVFGRSVTFHLQAEYAHRPGFKSWYSAQQSRMREDPLFGFLVDRRNLILKQGPLEVHKEVWASLHATATFSAFVEARVTRGKPWYQRSVKIIWEDLRSGLMRPIRKWRRHREITRRRAQAQPQPAGQVTEGLYFDDPAWRDRPALELLREYLDRLVALVTDADARFGDGTT